MAIKVFVSFDYENDKKFKFLLQAWSKNHRFSVSFDDVSSGEINSEDIGRVKAALSRKINEADIVLAIIGRYANQIHKDYRLIGDRNWISWEVNKGKELGKKIVAVKVDNSFISPDAVKNCNASWAKSFTEDAVSKALTGY